MHPAGLRSIEEAKRTGTWDDHDDVDQMTVPDDLAAALATFGATATWEGFPPSHRRNVLRWIRSAKTDLTRQKRIDTTAGLAAKSERVPNY